jgi:hypothetical protein
MKLKDLKPSVGLMRLWIASIIVFFIFTWDDSFDSAIFFGIDVIYSFFIYFFWLLVDLTNIFPEKEWKDRGDGYFLVRDLILSVSATITYVITTALTYVLIIWVKEGFSKSKDGN